jgi:pimeloyl-ACP methyl ester carboxylesterase
VNGIEGAREVVVENSSHTPVLEETDEYLDAISSFMRAAETP